MAFRASGPLGDSLKANRGEAVHLAVELSHGVFRGVPRAEISIIDAAPRAAALSRAA
ncbi:MAG: hypothetical protein AAGF45_03845 [Pseudomonadota bacterium]